MARPAPAQIERATETGPNSLMKRHKARTPCSLANLPKP